MWTKFLKLFFLSWFRKKKTKPKSESVKKAAGLRRKKRGRPPKKNLNTG